MAVDHLRRVLVSLLVLGLSACAAAPVGSPAMPAPASAELARTLQDHRWQLESATDAGSRRIEAVSPSPGRSFVFGFSGDRISIQGACNQFVGGYQIDADGRLAVGRLASTMKACPPTSMQADDALSGLLAGPMNVELVRAAQPTLRLTSAAAATLMLVGELTPEARYGPPTIIFLEVAAQPVPCSHDLAGGTACLQVRERRYDEQGLVVGVPGPWRAMNEAIEGFTHTAGVRNVVRVKRFERKAAPADASSFVYVLDLVVESEIVPK